MNLEWIKDKIISGDYYFSKHADNERQDDNLSFNEIEQAILNGIIIEDYTDSGRGVSSLVAGFSNSGKPIHIVCGIRGNSLSIITVYIPTQPKFANIFERNKND